MYFPFHTAICGLQIVVLKLLLTDSCFKIYLKEYNLCKKQKCVCQKFKHSNSLSLIEQE